MECVFVLWCFQDVEHSGIALDEKMDNILEDSVPWRVRAKRGCATHPRSIAERVTLFTCIDADSTIYANWQCISF